MSEAVVACMGVLNMLDLPERSSDFIDLVTRRAWSFFDAERFLAASLYNQ